MLFTLFFAVFSSKKKLKQVAAIPLQICFNLKTAHILIKYYLNILTITKQKKSLLFAKQALH